MKLEFLRLAVSSESFPAQKRAEGLPTIWSSKARFFTDWFQQEFDLPVSSLGVKRNVELRTFYSCNCHAAGVILEGQGCEAV